MLRSRIFCFAALAMLLSPFSAQAANVTAAGATRAITSDPEPNATVSAPLYMIHVMFNNPVNVATAKVNVADKGGKAIDMGEVMAMGTDGKTVMAMPKEPLPAGSYHVQWRASGSDGNPLQGEFTFTAR